MAKILLIETSTALCSTAIAQDGKVICSRESTAPRAHAAMTAPYVKQMLDECAMTASDLDAVCVSSGPGSYTGLRVGSSTAKGLCFGASRPLIAVPTPDVLVAQARMLDCIPKGCAHIVPMIDARRMEVYTAVYSLQDGQWKRESEIRPEIVAEGSFSDLLEQGPVLFIGDGVQKCAGVLAHPDAQFVQTNPCAQAMAAPAEQAWREGRFEDTAYFEPFYLKEFVATVSRKKLF